MRDEKVTVLVVFGTNDDINTRWLEHHKDIIPKDFAVLCVENFDAMCLRTANKLRYICSTKDNWRSLVLCGEQVCSEKYIHGDVLDIAVNYVHTPYILTMDSDFFVNKEELFERLLQVAEEENAAIVGELMGFYTIPYIHPACALYRTDVARKYFFAARWINDGSYIDMFYKKENEQYDVWADARRSGYLDTGCYLYLETTRAGLKTVNFPVNQYGEHLWGQTCYFVFTDAGVVRPHVRFVLPNGIPIGIVDF